MARFYARFDSGSANSQNTWVTALDNDYFNRRRIGANSGSGAALRNGLISSRSLLSTDALGDIADTYRNGAQGTIVPADLYTTNGSTYVSWSNAGGGVYTSPSSTGWGVVTPASYRTRPTGSIISTNSLLTQRAYEVGVAYTTYMNATSAVRAALDAVQNGAGTVNSPFTRPGYEPTRTFHGVWHDPELQYFSWDDFTPGTGLTPGVSFLGNSPVSVIVSVVDAQVQFANDWNPNGYIGFIVSIEGGMVATTLQLLADGTHAPAGGYIKVGTSYSAQTGPANPSGGGNSSWSWNGVNQLTWQITLPAGTYTVEAYTQFYDSTTKYPGAISTITTEIKTIT